MARKQEKETHYIIEKSRGGESFGSCFAWKGANCLYEERVCLGEDRDEKLCKLTWNKIHLKKLSKVSLAL